jgi:hypothetical protein
LQDLLTYVEALVDAKKVCMALNVLEICPAGDSE